MYLLAGIKRRNTVYLFHPNKDTTPSIIGSCAVHMYIWNEWITVEEFRPKVEVEHQDMRIVIISLKDIISKMSHGEINKIIISLAK